jgi:hypothetical protein
VSSSCTTAFWFSLWLTMNFLIGSLIRGNRTWQISCQGLMSSRTLALVEGSSHAF